MKLLAENPAIDPGNCHILELILLNILDEARFDYLLHIGLIDSREVDVSLEPSKGIRDIPAPLALSKNPIHQIR
jgi:hypothetical protein